MTCMPSLHPERRHFLKQMLGAALLCSSSSLRPQWTVLFRHNYSGHPFSNAKRAIPSPFGGRNSAFRGKY